MKQFFTQIPDLLKFVSLAEVTPHLRLDKTFGHYQVKTVTTKKELKEVLELRFEVFYREFAEQVPKKKFATIDIDSHDFLCDHLIVKDKRNQKIIACYRLLSSKFKPKNKNFYSQSEFIIDDFLNTSESVLELGRACVHKDYRKGTVIVLLWRGLIDYAIKCQTRYLFGCSSIGRSQFAHVPEILSEIEKQDAYIKEWKIGIMPKYKFDLEKLNAALNEHPKSMNSLMQLYISAGAKVSAELAYDDDMNCLDLLTILDMNHLPESYTRNLDG